MTDQMTHAEAMMKFAEYSDEIETLRARVAELEKENAQMRDYGSPRCVLEAEKLVSELEEQLAAVTKERDSFEVQLKACQESLTEVITDASEAYKKGREDQIVADLPNELAKYDLAATLCPICGDTAGTNESRVNKKLAACEKVLAACEKERDRAQSAYWEKTAELEAQLAASQHYEQQLRDVLVNIEEFWNRDRNESTMEGACWHAVNAAHEALYIPNDTTALDQLKAGLQIANFALMAADKLSYRTPPHAEVEWLVKMAPLIDEWIGAHKAHGVSDFSHQCVKDAIAKAEGGE